MFDFDDGMEFAQDEAYELLVEHDEAELYPRVCVLLESELDVLSEQYNNAIPEEEIVTAIRICITEARESVYFAGSDDAEDL